MAKGQNHQIVKTPRDCPGVKHQNFEKKNSLHCFLYPSTTFKKLKPKIQNEVVFLKRPNTHTHTHQCVALEIASDRKHIRKIARKHIDRGTCYPATKRDEM